MSRYLFILRPIINFILENEYPVPKNATPCKASESAAFAGVIKKTLQFPRHAGGRV